MAKLDLTGISPAKLAMIKGRLMGMKPSVACSTCVHPKAIPIQEPCRVCCNVGGQGPIQCSFEYWEPKDDLTEEELFG